MRVNYTTTELADYINWVYFYHAWSVPPSSNEAMRLRADADHLLQVLRPYAKARCAVEVLPAYSEGDDIVVSKTYLCECGQYHTTGETVRLPMLRQQTPGKDGLCWCLSDFVRPRSVLRSDRIGVFATSVSVKGLAEDNDEYRRMLMQTVCDRLAEAAAEKLHEEVRRHTWGYAPNEHLSIADLHAERFQGIRPAVGYPCLPDVSINFLIDQVIAFDTIGVTLTEHGMMHPHASVSGLMISHPKSQYFSIGRIDDTQLADYARRRGMKADDARMYLTSIL